MKLDFEKICRTCLNEQAKMHSIYDACLINMLMNFSTIKIEKSDGLPEQICDQCILQISKSYAFKQLCEKSDATLRLYIVERNKHKTQSAYNQSSKNNEININLIELQENANSPKDSTNHSEPKIKNSSEKVNSEEDTCTNYFKCTICFKQFIEREKYREHLKIHWNLDSYICPICSKPCGLPSLLTKHMKTHSSGKESNHTVQQSLTDIKEIHKKDNINQKYKCNHCSKTFTETTYLRIHERSHANKKSLPCKVCGEKFTCTSSLETHLKNHKSTYQCAHCLKMFANQQRLTVHNRIHTGEKPFICNVYGKSTTTLGNLQVHLRIHSGEKPYHCNICNSSYATKTQLTVHVKRHKGIKSHLCKICEKKFTEKHELMIHMRYHTDERRYSCTVCSKKFIATNHLKQHMRIHTGEKPYSCTICEKSFVVRRSLREHMKVHNINAHTCSSCGQNFSELDTFNTHIKIHGKQNADVN